jgi:hypothetical protein
MYDMPRQGSWADDRHMLCACWRVLGIAWPVEAIDALQTIEKQTASSPAYCVPNQISLDALHGLYLPAGPFCRSMRACSTGTPPWLRPHNTKCLLRYVFPIQG